MPEDYRTVLVGLSVFLKIITIWNFLLALLSRIWLLLWLTLPQGHQFHLLLGDVSSPLTFLVVSGLHSPRAGSGSPWFTPHFSGAHSFLNSLRLWGTARPCMWRRVCLLPSGLFNSQLQKELQAGDLAPPDLESTALLSLAPSVSVEKSSSVDNLILVLCLWHVVSTRLWKLFSPEGFERSWFKDLM